MNTPKITIITPTFNQGEYIEQTIKSVIEQDYKNLELIIIDGGSTDGTVDIINKYSSCLSYWVSEPDKGQAHAINKGLAKATGEIFNWLNSDDYLEPGALKAIAKGFQDNPTKKIICGYTHCFYDETGETSHTYQMGLKNTVAGTIMDVEMNQPGSFYAMEAIRSLGVINTSLRYVFDDELWFRFLCKYGLEAVGFTDALIAHFRLHKSSKSVNEGFFEFYKELLNVHLHLASEAKLPHTLLQCLEKQQYVKRYIPQEPWALNYLEVDKLYGIIADKYKFLLYKDRAYKDAREGLKFSMRNRNSKDIRLKFLLGLKLMLPDSVIEKLRQQVN